jgi:phage-related protein
MPLIGQGVEEIQIWDEAGTFRVICAACSGDRVVVLHAFQKKTQTTSIHDIELARARWSHLKKER